MKQIITKGLLVLLLVLSCSMQAQDKVVNGVVIDETGTPLPGASILVKGSSNGVATDFDGNYSIHVNDTDTLIASYIGYIAQEISVNGQTIINIALLPDANTLEEVVVVGYGSQKKSDLTGAVASVKPEDFSPGANYNAAQLLNGAAAGVNVSQVSSAPGSSMKVQIRGAGSINSSNDVLYVVDGVPGISTNSINPEDIESIEVLKDASSAAIYGTRAANGVVLITTKKGKAGKQSVSYSGYTGFQNVDNRLDLLKSSDYMRLINQRQGSAVYTDQDIAQSGVGTDWQDEIFKDGAVIQNHNISISGGNEKSTHFIGLNYFDQEGVVRTSGYKRYNGRINVQTNPINNLKLTTNLSITHSDENAIAFSNLTNEAAGPINAAIQYDPTISTGFDENGQYLRNGTIALDNPIALIDGRTNSTIATNVNGLVQADYEFLKNLTLTTRFGIDILNSREDTYLSRLTNAAQDRGTADVNSIEYIHWLTEYLLQYKNTFNTKHDLTLIAGTTIEKFSTKTLGAYASNFITDDLLTNQLGTGDGIDGDGVSSSKVVNQLHGVIGRVNYGFDDKYLLTASARIDGSSRFSEGNKYAVFPSGSVAWRLSQEQFLYDTDWVTDLKLRIGYGQLGNQGISNFLTRSTFLGGGNFISGGTVQQGVLPARLPNPDLKWETTQEINYGLDYGFLNNRISGSIDVFNRKTKDQLFFKPLPAASGFSGVWVNFGEVVNKGVDFQIKSKNIQTNNFNWNTTVNISFINNKVTQLPDFTQQIISGSLGGFVNGFNIVEVGLPMQSFYGYEVNGIIQESDDVANMPTPVSAGDKYRAGMPRFVDQNNDGVIDADDRIVLGDPFADVAFGINNNLTFKNFNLSFFVNGVSGIETIDGNVIESIYPTNSARNSIKNYFVNQWTPENTSSSLPNLLDSNLYGGGLAINSLTVKDASFVRLKNVTLGYNVPNVDHFGLSSLSFYVSADNLLTITNFEGYDPDASSAGTNSTLNTNSVGRVNYNTYPLARVFRLGLNVKF